MNGYQHLQRIAKALKQDELVEAFGADSLQVWSASKTRSWCGTALPAMVWEEGPFEWTFTFTGSFGEQIDDETRIKLSPEVNSAYLDMRDDGYYLECESGYMVYAVRM